MWRKVEVEEEPDLRARLNKNKHTAEEEVLNNQEEPRSEGELTPTDKELCNAAKYGFNLAPWPRPFTKAIYKERDESKAV